MSRPNYRSTFWLKSKHVAWVRRMKRNPQVTEAVLRNTKAALLRRESWAYQLRFGIERWWELRRFDRS